jgi:membrane associated rhomboid family serine protease
MFRITPIVRNLLIINIGLLLLQYVTNLNFSGLLGLRYIFAESFQPYQFFTYMFVHANFWHLFSNMFALFIFGPMLERYWGSKKFLLFYIVTGVGAGVLFAGVNYFEIRGVQQDVQTYIDSPNPQDYNQFIYDHFQYRYGAESDFIDEFDNNPENSNFIQESVTRIKYYYSLMANIPMVGASGAVFGILMAFGLYFPNLELFLLFPPIPIKAKYLVTFYGLYELYAGVERMPGDNVAHWAHLGGMLIAFLVIKFWFRDKTNVY